MNAPLPKGAALAAPEDAIDYWECYPSVAPVLLNNGFEPIPVEGKRAMGFGWQSIRITEALVRATASRLAGASVGLRTGHLVGGDIDITDPVVAERVAQSCVDRFGVAPVRIGRAPKLMLAYYTDKPGPKHTSPVWVDPEGITHKIEILGVGQQFVAYGIHPDTSQPYRWPNGGPLNMEAYEFPTVDLEDVWRWVDEVVPTTFLLTGWSRRPARRGDEHPMVRTTRL